MLQTLLHDWLTPQGIIAAGVLYGIFQAHIAAARAKAGNKAIEKLEINTNSIQEKLNTANLDLGHAQGRAEAMAEAAVPGQSDVKPV
jgi:hypothetical protein